jgi:hypothetical protein
MSHIEHCIFLLESVAHLQGKEKELLPFVDDARIQIDKILEHLGVIEAMSASDSVNQYTAEINSIKRLLGE